MFQHMTAMLYRDIGLGDGENMRPILSRRSELPTEVTVDMKLRGTLDLYEGNRPFVRDNTLLKSYHIQRNDFFDLTLRAYEPNKIDVLIDGFVTDTLHFSLNPMVEEETIEELEYREWYHAKKEYQNYLDTTRQFVSEPNLQLVETDRQVVLHDLEEAYKVLGCSDVTTEEYKLCLSEIEGHINPYLLKFKDCVYQ
jgi:hypothetical protein